MIFRIPAGRHRALPLRFGFWWRRNSFAWVVKFTDSCRYGLGNEDQFDTNKLVGIGYLPSHHKDSARFGWRYWTDRKEIELTAYCYVNGRRVIQHVGFAKIDQWCRIHLTVATYYYHFNMEVMNNGMYEPGGDIIIDHNNQKRLQYRLGVYFGGNRKAPHEMKIELNRG